MIKFMDGHFGNYVICENNPTICKRIKNTLYPTRCLASTNLKI